MASESASPDDYMDMDATDIPPWPSPPSNVSAGSAQETGGGTDVGDSTAAPHDAPRGGVTAPAVSAFNDGGPPIPVRRVVDRGRESEGPQLHDGPAGPPSFSHEFDDSLAKWAENELERSRSEHARDYASAMPVANAAAVGPPMLEGAGTAASTIRELNDGDPPIPVSHVVDHGRESEGPQLHNGPPGPPCFLHEFDDSLAKRVENDSERSLSNHARDNESTEHSTTGASVANAATEGGQSAAEDAGEGGVSLQGTAPPTSPLAEAAVNAVFHNPPSSGRSTFIAEAYRVDGGRVYEAELAEPQAAAELQAILPFYQRKGYASVMAALTLIAIGIVAVTGVLLSKNLDGNGDAGDDKNNDAVLISVVPQPSPPQGQDSVTGQSALKSLVPSSAPVFNIPFGSVEQKPAPFVATEPDTPEPISNKPTLNQAFIITTLAPTSAAPSSAGPVSARVQAAINKLSDLSGGDVFNDTSSPQFLAAMWISREDTLQLGVDDPRFVQRYIMALFFFAMDGKNWSQSQGWLSEEHECYWFGVLGSSVDCGSGLGGCNFVDDYDRVCRISTGRLNNLYGQLPSELGNLTEMRYFEIQDDYLYGTLPRTLGNWDKLHTFLVGGNFLSGGFPATFEGNEMLGTIFLDRNRFNTSFPNVFGTLKNLEWLDAEQNEFKGSLPASITSLKRLRILNLNDNSLTGHLPDKWDEDNLIEDFEVADNDFEGPLPPTLASARFLKDIHMSRNQLTGSLPTSYNNLGSLEELYLDGNQFTGELPQAATIYYGLQEFTIHSNNFEGRFPAENFENTRRVKTLELHGNPLLTGVITDNICARRDPSLSYTRLLSLTAICDMIDCGCCDCYDFDGDLISIALPTRSPVEMIKEEVQAPTNIDDTGEIMPQPTASPVTWSPISVGERKQAGITEQIEREVLQRGAVFFVMDDTDPRLKALHWILYLDQMQLGTQDANLNQRYVLAVMAFSFESEEWHTCGSAEISGEECQYENVLTLQVSKHKTWLSGTNECDWFGVSCDSEQVVRGIELIRNDLIGEIPAEISQLGRVEYIALIGNCLYGTIPPELGSMANLLALDLHGNGLSGIFPEELYNASKLQLLNVAMQFQYAHTCEREDGSQVNTLYAGGDPANGYNWGLQGQILGPEVSTWRSMMGLHVFDNSFDGTIADEIGDLKYLEFLRAQNNAIAGMIPSPITRLSMLRELMLGKNEIYSDLPPDIGNMENLEDLRVNENEMFGEIPNSLYQLKKLKKLWLEDTLKCEEIRDDKGQLSGYDCDMSSEYGFDGPISSEIGNLSRLSYLIINNNPLTGTLPSEIGLCEELAVLHIHQTDLEGTLPAEVCELRDKSLNSDTGTGVFYADCLADGGAGPPQIECKCCTDCCDHTTKVCISDD